MHVARHGGRPPDGKLAFQSGNGPPKRTRDGTSSAAYFSLCGSLGVRFPRATRPKLTSSISGGVSKLGSGAACAFCSRKNMLGPK